MHRNPRFGRRSAARLLDGEPVDSADDLARLLAAAGAEASARELRGEYAAVAAFRSASLSPAPSAVRRPSVIKTALAKLFAAKALLGGAVAVAATGGIALAASAGNLPGASGHAGPNGTPTGSSTPAPASSHHAHHGTPVRPDHARGGAPSASSSSRSSGTPASATPSPSLTGLCHAYQAGATTNPGKALQNPAFTVLITAAGGPANVSSFCTNLIGAPSTHSAGNNSTHPAGAPTTHPGNAPTNHPADRRTSHPTGAPTNHPGNAPTSHPHGG